MYNNNSPRDGNAYFDHSENVQYHQEEKSTWFWERKVNAGAEKPTLLLYFYIYIAWQLWYAVKSLGFAEGRQPERKERAGSRRPQQKKETDRGRAQAVEKGGRRSRKALPAKN